MRLKKKRIYVEWQRLIVDKKTCFRCSGTEKEIYKAIKKLNDKGIKVELKKRRLSMAIFKSNPLLSNLILVNGKPLEYWIKAKTEKTFCSSICGGADCRTVKFDGSFYEVIPASLIVKAVEKAAKI